ncbi:baseplate J/gp47 family protein [Leisingera sp. MMG026]|uniref:baseplate assembly protein n=1 Tax=Leisingera sp. MMG026 TaxID=2909982 RepID=UPI001F34FDF1|nr:baseplate J/gp47 family protein [Leisingera sp. MMG026]MCF6432907.1 baseplate J/gp47 family protein [Leisingera sp. MMG026]
MSGFTSIDHSKLPPPEIIRTVGFEPLFEEMKAEAAALMPELAPFLQLESEPVTKLIRVFAYYRMLDRLEFNDDARGLLLALSTGGALDGLGAFWGVGRLVVQEADDSVSPPIPEIKESDDAFRHRIQLSMEGRSTAGPRGAYIYWALTAAGSIKDVSAAAPRFERLDLSPELAAQLPAGAIVLTVADDAGLADPLPGDVAVTVLDQAGDGMASEEVLSAVETTLNGEEIRPLTDRPRIRSASILPYQVSATLILKTGPDRGAVLQTAAANLQAYVDRQHHLGQDIAVGAIYAALYVEGVDRVQLHSPAADIEVGPSQAAYCPSEDITLIEGNGSA